MKVTHKERKNINKKIKVDQVKIRAIIRGYNNAQRKRDSDDANVLNGVFAELRRQMSSSVDFSKSLSMMNRPLHQPYTIRSIKEPGVVTHEELKTRLNEFEECSELSRKLYDALLINTTLKRILYADIKKPKVSLDVKDAPPVNDVISDYNDPVQDGILFSQQYDLQYPAPNGFIPNDNMINYAKDIAHKNAESIGTPRTSLHHLATRELMRIMDDWNHYLKQITPTSAIDAKLYEDATKEIVASLLELSFISPTTGLTHRLKESAEAKFITNQVFNQNSKRKAPDRSNVLSELDKADLLECHDKDLGHQLDFAEHGILKTLKLIKKNIDDAIAENDKHQSILDKAMPAPAEMNYAFNTRTAEEQTPRNQRVNSWHSRQRPIGNMHDLPEIQIPLEKFPIGVNRYIQHGNCFSNIETQKCCIDDFIVWRDPATGYYYLNQILSISSSTICLKAVTFDYKK